MENELRKLCRYEDSFWFIDLSEKAWVVKEVNLDGTMKDANISWGYFMEILNGGPCFAKPPSNPSRGWLKNAIEKI